MIHLEILPSIVQRQCSEWRRGVSIFAYTQTIDWWKQRKRAYFCVCVSTHFLQTGHKISMIYCNKVHEMFTRCRGFIRVSMWVYFCDLPNRCKMPAQTIKAFHAKLPTCCRFVPQNWLLWQRLLTEVHPIFSHRIFSSTVLRQQSTLRFVHPLWNERGNS